MSKIEIIKLNAFLRTNPICSLKGNKSSAHFKRVKAETEENLKRVNLLKLYDFNDEELALFCYKGYKTPLKRKDGVLLENFLETGRIDDDFYKLNLQKLDSFFKFDEKITEEKDDPVDSDEGEVFIAITK
ncbi:hypothetical protein MHBO_000057 [Bonamia ostreae]|uniref:Uncharacterized protein n=1 Tax=Bonamia ostreae TaxID=126728 RepID=A0ABV2AE78_9EUKA